MKMLILAAAAAGVAGCAMQPASRATWVKTGAAREDFSKAYYQCALDARRADPIAAVGSEEFWSIAGPCLNAQGWYLQQARR